VPFIFEQDWPPVVRLALQPWAIWAAPPRPWRL